MSEIMQQIVGAAVPVLCLLITAGGAYLVALVKRQTAQLQQQLDDETLSKYMDMAAEAVVQAVTYTAQTFVDTLKEQGAFTKEKQLEAFQRSKDKVLEILGDTVVEALNELYGDFDAWLTTKIEQTCRDIKTPETTAATTAAATTAASVAAAITSTAVQQIAAEAAVPGAEASVEVEIGEETGGKEK